MREEAACAVMSRKLETRNLKKIMEIMEAEVTT